MVAWCISTKEISATNGLASTPAMFNIKLTEDEEFFCLVDGSITITGSKSTKSRLKDVLILYLQLSFFVAEVMKKKRLSHLSGSPLSPFAGFFQGPKRNLARTCTSHMDPSSTLEMYRDPCWLMSTWRVTTLFGDEGRL